MPATYLKMHPCINSTLICLGYSQLLKLPNSNSTSSTNSVAVSSSTGDKQKVDRMSALFNGNSHLSHQLPAVSPSIISAHKMSTGIRRTVSSAAPSTGLGIGSRPIGPPGAHSVVKSLSNTQASAAVRGPVSSAHHLSKEPHKKLDRSFSEPAEKKSPASSSTAATSSTSIGPSSRYKTELCRSFAEVGQCKYGDKCQFAHGEEELRTVNRHPKFKTENCKSFHSTGFCPYGPRCHFIHNDEQKKGILSNLQGSSTSTTAPSTICQRMFTDCDLSAPIAVTGNHMSATSQPAALAQPPFHTSTSASLLNNANVVRPKALSLGSYSLGSSGEMSPPSSQSGSPTSLNSFFGEDGFGLSHPFASRMAQGSAFTGNSTISFSPDSAFSLAGCSSNGSTSGSSLSFDGNQVPSLFGGSQPVLSSPEPGHEPTSSMLFSLFASSETSQLNDFLSPMMMYPSSPESPVDSVASEIEALKLGEVSSSFSPISSSFSTASQSPSSASPPNGMEALTFHSSAAPGASVAIPRLPTFARFATSAHE